MAETVFASKPRLDMINRYATKYFRSLVNHMIAQAFALRVREPGNDARSLAANLPNHLND
ncbi:MAG: hypothetical protein ABGZ35_04680 [Planctomycetaceae bacterium]